MYWPRIEISIKELEVVIASDSNVLQYIAFPPLFWMEYIVKRKTGGKPC
jgi:hypothetical protein